MEVPKLSNSWSTFAVSSFHHLKSSSRENIINIPPTLIVTWVMLIYNEFES